MTNLTTLPGGSQRFVAPSGQAAPDITGLINPSEVPRGRGPIGPVDFQVLNVSKDGLEIDSKWTIYDLGGPYLQRGPLGQAHAAHATSTVDGTSPGEATLQLDTTHQDTVDFGVGSLWHTSWVSAFGRLAISLMADDATHSTFLVAETDAANPVLVQLTYDKGLGSVVTGLYEVRLGATPVTYVAVCKDRDQVELLSDLGATPTILGEMNAATLQCWGAITTPLGNTLLHLGYSMYSLANLAAYNAAPDITWQGSVPPGGGVLGLASIRGAAPATVWLLPKRIDSSYRSAGISASSGGLLSQFEGQIETFNALGFGRNKVKFPLENVRNGAIVRNGVLADDGKQLEFIGRIERSLHIFANRPNLPTRELRIGNYHIINERDIYVWVNEIAAPGSSGVTRIWPEFYDWDNETWNQVGPAFTSAAQGIQTHATVGPAPFSPQTGYMHQRLGPNTGTAGADGSWLRYWRPIRGTSPYSVRGVKAFAGTGTHDWPVMPLPYPISYGKHEVVGHFFGGELENSAQISFRMAPTAPTATWVAPAGRAINDASRHSPVKDNQTRFMFAQPTLVITQTPGNALSTPQALPITVYLKTYMPGHAKWADGGGGY